MIPLEGIIDIQKHKEKIDQKISKAQSDIKSKKAMLDNKDFVKKAPREIVDAENEKLCLLEEELKKLRGLRDGFKT